MGKIIAIIFVIVFIWVSYPHFARGEWLAPTAVPPGYWGLEYTPELTYLSRPPQGYGWYRFDVWNNPPVTGRPVRKGDFRF